MSLLDPKKGNGKAAPQQVFMLGIAMEADTGKIVVNGPIDNKPLCYQMLAGAAAAIVAHKPKQTGLIGHVDPLAVKGMKGN